MRPLALCAMAILLLTSNGSSQQAARRRPSSQPVSVEAEGRREAEKFWNNYVAACNGSRYVKKTSSVFVELRGFGISMNYEPLNEADRLNGVQAKGVSRYTAVAHRFYANLAWQRWENGIPEDMVLVNAVRFRKAGGRWMFQEDGYFSQYAKPVACSDLPGARRRDERPTNSVEIDDAHNFPILNFVLWESSSNDPGTRFSQSRATFINWRITYTETAFDYPPPSVAVYWYKNGVRWSYSGGAKFSNRGQGLLRDGKGWAEPGHWEIGRYTIKIYVRQKLSAVGEFEIVPDESLPKELRFDGFYKAVITDNTKQPSTWTEWLRFYENGTYYWAITPDGFNDNLDRLGTCLSSRGIACQGIEVQTGTYTLSGSHVQMRMNYRIDEGELGPGTISSSSNAGFSAKYAFINASGWLCDRDRKC